MTALITGASAGIEAEKSMSRKQIGETVYQQMSGLI
jgi:hypothetical protein|tara:strand:+ start:811 stop:918 length:108 start_codon:yes stop_codon:yes gene_type:complete